MIRKIAQIQRRLTEIDAQIEQLSLSDLYQLRAKANEAENQGRDLLKEMASQVEQQIVGAKARLATVNENLDA